VRKKSGYGRREISSKRSLDVAWSDRSLVFGEFSIFLNRFLSTNNYKKAIQYI
jgi:hypothetical protein